MKRKTKIKLLGCLALFISAYLHCAIIGYSWRTIIAALILYFGTMIYYYLFVIFSEQ